MNKDKAPERHYWRCSGAFIIYFEHISHPVLFAEFELKIALKFEFN